MKSLVTTLAANGAVIGFVTLGNFEVALKIVLLLLSCAYTSLMIALAVRNLKGDKGDKGDRGQRGLPGKAGKDSPQ